MFSIEIYTVATGKMLKRRTFEVDVDRGREAFTRYWNRYFGQQSEYGWRELTPRA